MTIDDVAAISGERDAALLLGVGLVDAAAVGRLAGADDVDDQVAREGEQRDGIGLRVGAHEHDRVGAGGDPGGLDGGG